MSRLEVDPENRVILHSHPTYTLAMNFVHPLDEKSFTHTLWAMHGIYGAGRTIDEVFGLAETFGVKYREDFLDI